MNRQQRRQLEREKSKQIEKDAKEHINKLKKIKPTSLRFKTSEWAMSLKDQEQIYLSTMILENSRHDISTYEECYNIVLENNLDKEIIEKINNQLLEEGKLVEKYRNDGGDYIMAIKNNSKQIIAEYKKAIKTKDKAIVIEDIAFKYGVTENAVKSIVKDIKLEKECTSAKCPFVKDGKCTNETVLSGKGDCRNMGEPCKVTKVTKDKTIVTKKQQIEEFIEGHKDKTKVELIELIAKEFSIQQSSARDYINRWKNSKKGSCVLDKVLTMSNPVRKGDKEMKKSKFKVLKEVVQRDVQGECGIYHIEGGKIQIENSTYSTKEDVEKDYKDTIEEIEKTYKELVDKANKLREEKIKNADFCKGEVLEIMEEFM